jgi:TPR repeat protein
VIDIGVNLAPLYMLDKEYKNAYKIYQILSTINDHVALTALGNLYRNGFYVTKDLNKALDYYQKAFKHGNLTAPIRTAGIYRQQGKYLKSLILLIKTIINRYTEVFNENKDAGEIFREM